jgi:hypothetical protein
MRPSQGAPSDRRFPRSIGSNRFLAEDFRLSSMARIHPVTAGIA